jgi:uncharacterized RDD family membrane protein YckC
VSGARLGAARRILTPEHVEVRLLPAGPASRFLAVLIDSLIATGISLGVTARLSPLLPAGLAGPLFASLDFVLTWGYHVFFEVRRGGQTPGKRLFGLRVVDGRGLPLTLEQSFVRNVVRVLDIAPAFYGLGALALGLDKSRRRLGDVVADTLVVEEGRAASLAVSAARREAPTSLRTPRLVAQIRRRIGVEEREFLAQLVLRADSLEPRARFDIFEDVGAHYRQRLEIDDRTLSGENLVRGVAAVLFDRRGPARPRPRAAAVRSGSISATR